MNDTLRKNWDGLFQTAVWLSSVVYLAVAAPPRFLTTDATPPTSAKAGQIFVAVCVGLVYFLFQRSAGNRWKKSRSRFAIAGFVFLLAAIIATLVYQAELEAWTCSYDSRGLVTVGNTFLPQILDYLAAHPEATCERLIQITAGAVDKIWPKNEIVFHHVMLITTFMIAGPCYVAFGTFGSIFGDSQ